MKEIFDINKNPVKKEVFNVEWDVEAAEKGGYEHFMEKEMNENVFNNNQKGVNSLGVGVGNTFTMYTYIKSSHCVVYNMICQVYLNKAETFKW